MAPAPSKEREALLNIYKSMRATKSGEVHAAPAKKVAKKGKAAAGAAEEQLKMPFHREAVSQHRRDLLPW